MRSALFALTMLLGMAVASRAGAPDPKDSVIIESKTVAPGLSGNPAFTLKVYITNKDTIGILTMVLVESTLAKTGSAYAVLDSTGSGDSTDHWALADCLTFLKSTLDSHPIEDFIDYNATSPDLFMLGGTFAPIQTNPVRRAEPPNRSRSAIWELQFMSSSKATGKVILDTVRVDRAPNVQTGFTIIRQRGQYVEDVPVNFVAGVITIGAAKKAGPKKGELFPGFQRPTKDALLYCNVGTPEAASEGEKFRTSKWGQEEAADGGTRFFEAICRDEKFQG